MQSSQQNNNSQENFISCQETPPQIDSSKKSLGKPSFSPFLVKSLICSSSGSVVYNQKYNIIIVDSQNTLVFYNASTLDQIKVREIHDWPTYMSYCDEIDTCFIGCDSGFIYSYNVFKDELNHLKDCVSESEISRVKYLNSKFYAFILNGPKEIYIGNLENKNIVIFAWPNIDPKNLHYLTQSKLLLASFGSGSVKIFKTNKLPHLQAFCTAQAHRNENIYVLESFYINGKEYVMTSGGDGTLKIWHLIKGRMRLLKVVQTEGKIADSAVYLENYKMVAVSYEVNHIDFFRLPFWKLERTFCFGGFKERHGLFLMKDKNMLGCIGDFGFRYKAIDFVQLGHQEDEKKFGE